MTSTWPPTSCCSSDSQPLLRDTGVRPPHSLRAEQMRGRFPALHSRMVTCIAANEFAIKLACIFYIFMGVSQFGESSFSVQACGGCRFLWQFMALQTGTGHVTSERLCHTSLYGLVCSHKFVLTSQRLLRPHCTGRVLQASAREGAGPQPPAAQGLCQRLPLSVRHRFREVPSTSLGVISLRMP